MPSWSSKSLPRFHRRSKGTSSDQGSDYGSPDIGSLDGAQSDVIDVDVPEIGSLAEVHNEPTELDATNGIHEDLSLGRPQILVEDEPETDKPKEESLVDSLLSHDPPRNNERANLVGTGFTAPPGNVDSEAIEIGNLAPPQREPADLDDSDIEPDVPGQYVLSTTEKEQKEEEEFLEDYPHVPARSPFGLPLADDFIRLVELCPGKGYEQIRCKLLDPQRVSEADEFEALSYACGNEHDDAKIDLSGKLYSVTRNLKLALRYLRHEDAPRTLWIDAMCINPGDYEEKMRQVLMMRSIYTRASRVVVWLGKESFSWPKYVAFDLCERIMEYQGRLRLGSRYAMWYKTSLDDLNAMFNQACEEAYQSVKTSKTSEQPEPPSERPRADRTRSHRLHRFASYGRSALSSNGVAEWLTTFTVQICQR